MPPTTPTTNLPGSVLHASQRTRSVLLLVFCVLVVLPIGVGASLYLQSAGGEEASGLSIPAVGLVATAMLGTYLLLSMVFREFSAVSAAACSMLEHAPPADSAARSLRPAGDEVIGVGHTVLELERTVRTAFGELAEKAERLEKANLRLRELDRLKSDLISNVSHELRTPLTSIRSYSEILLHYADGIDTEKRQQFVGIINSESQRLTALINDFLDLAKIESGRMRWHLSTFDLRELLEEVSKALEPLANEAELALAVSAPETPVPFYGDRDRLHQVVQNLLSNAIKFTEPGGSVRVGCEATHESEDGVTIEVVDDGIGIAADRQESIFERFSQVENDLRGKPKGTGLGLPIVREIVDAHDGDVELESAPGMGSAFRVRLPNLERSPGLERQLRWRVSCARKRGEHLSAVLVRVSDRSSGWPASLDLEALLTPTVRAEDTVVATGQVGSAVVISPISRSAAEGLAGRLETYLEDRAELPAPIAIDVQVASFPDDGEGWQQLMQALGLSPSERPATPRMQLRALHRVAALVAIATAGEQR